MKQILISLILFSTPIMGYNNNLTNKKDSLWVFITSKDLISKKIDLASNSELQNSICPPLHPKRFNRRMKILYGIDVNFYPPNSYLRMIASGEKEYYINIKTQLLYIVPDDITSGFILYDGPVKTYNLAEEIDNVVPPLSSIPSEQVLSILRKTILLNDQSTFDFFVKYREEIFNKLENTNDCDIGEALEYYPFDNFCNLDVVWNLFINMQYYVDLNTLRYLDTTNIKMSDVINKFWDLPNFTYNTYYSDMRKDIIDGVSILDINYQEQRIIRYNDINSQLLNIYNIRCTDVRKIRLQASLLNNMLRLKNKTLISKVIAFILGKISYMGINSIDSFLNIKSNNYYGYTLLREFCENTMREMPTLEKIGTNFEGIVKEKDVLLYLEPFADSFDIDSIQPTETFKAYEMGHDDYYFVEIEKPVESPVAGPDGYAMILDRTELVYGYVLKNKVRPITDAD